MWSYYLMWSCYFLLTISMLWLTLMWIFMEFLSLGFLALFRDVIILPVWSFQRQQASSMVVGVCFCLKPLFWFITSTYFSIAFIWWFQSFSVLVPLQLIVFCFRIQPRSLRFFGPSLKSFLAILPVSSFQRLQASCSCHSKHLSGIYFSFRSILGFIVQHGSCASSWFSEKWSLFIKSIKRSVLLFAAYGYSGSHHQGGAFVMILSSICILSPSHH